MNMLEIESTDGRRLCLWRCDENTMIRFLGHMSIEEGVAL